MQIGIAAAQKSAEATINYAAAKRRIDADQILEHYGALNVSRRGDELVHSCLIDKVQPHHAHGDQNPAAALNVKSLQYSCFSYGGGGLLWFIQEMEQCDEEQALSVLVGFMNDRWGDEGGNLLEIVKSYLPKAENDDIPTYSKVILKPWKKLHPYMTDERDLYPETLKRYLVGYDTEQDKVVIPHFWKGELVGWQKRRLSTTPWEPGAPKYKSSANFPKRQTLFNYDTVRERGIEDVVLVESPMSVLRAESLVDLGDPQFGNVLATFGAKVTPQQLELLRNFRSVTVYFDADIAGWRGATMVYEALKAHTKVYLVWPLTGRDMADLDAEDLDWVLSTRRLGALTKGRFTAAWKEAQRANDDAKVHAEEQA